MFERIMVPVDGSAFAEFALAPAAAIARRTGGHVDLVTVRDAAEAAPEEERSAWIGRYQDLLVEQLTELWGRPPCRHVLRGPTVPALLAYARERDAGLIVLASHGRGPLSRFWLGSTADGIIRQASAPVLVMRPPEGEEADLGEEPTIRNVVLAVDGSERAETALCPALEIARAFGARLTLLHVVETPLELGSPYIPHAARHAEEETTRQVEEAESYMALLAERAKEAGPRVETAVRVDQGAARGILRFLRKEGGDLVAIATHARGGVPRLVLGSVADKVLRATETPLLIVRPGC